MDTLTTEAMIETTVFFLSLELLFIILYKPIFQHSLIISMWIQSLILTFSIITYTNYPKKELRKNRVDFLANNIVQECVHLLKNNDSKTITNRNYADYIDCMKEDKINKLYEKIKK